jgi:Fe-S cluster biogenesis protein NfuA
MLNTLKENTLLNRTSILAKGACGSCPMSIMTLKGGIEAELKKAIPEIKSVEAV